MKRCPECGSDYRGDPVRCPLDGALLQPTPDEHEGEVIDGWHLGSALAEGAYATVYRARRPGVEGALKLYRPSAPLRRSERESVIHQRLRHPHVAALLAQGVSSGGQVYLVTELIEGQPLRALVAAHPGGIPWPRACSLITQAAAGLEAIHEQGLVHRDLKPENVMLRRTGAAREQLVLLDLGHALVLDQRRLTESGMVWGSAPYMSPEQVAGHPLDARSDLYSLGVLLYEMVTGRRPFVAKSAVEVMQMHWNQAPVPPDRCASVPAALSDLCLWLLAKQPALRPPTARVAIAALQGLGTLAAREGTQPEPLPVGLPLRGEHQ